VRRHFGKKEGEAIDKPIAVKKIAFGLPKEADPDEVNFHNDAIEYCPFGYKLMASSWFYSQSTDGTENLCAPKAAD